MVVYHGGKRTSDPAELAAADVVLTTYSIVESEYRKNCIPGKVPCRYCRQKMYPDRLKLHLKCDSFCTALFSCLSFKYLLDHERHLHGCGVASSAWLSSTSFCVPVPVSAPALLALYYCISRAPAAVPEQTTTPNVWH